MIPAVTSVQNGMVLANADFTIMLSDYKITIPFMVAHKVSNKVRIVVNLKYEPHLQS